MKRNQKALIASLTLGLAAACGGNTTSSGPAGSGSTSGSSSGSSTGRSSGSSTGSTGSGTASGGSSGGAGSGAPMPTGPILSGNGTPGTGSIVCGTGPACAAPMVCCSGGRGGASCMTLAACDANNDSFTCTGPANCAAPSVCCFRQSVTLMMNDQTTCETRTSCASGPGMPQEVCVVDADCANGLVCGAGNGTPRGILRACQMPAAPQPEGGTPPVDAGAPAVDAGEAGTAPAPEAGVADAGMAPGADAGIVDAARDAGGG